MPEADLRTVTRRWLADYLAKHNISANKLAKGLDGLYASNISAILRGDRNLTLGNIAEICRAQQLKTSTVLLEMVQIALRIEAGADVEETPTSRAHPPPAPSATAAAELLEAKKVAAELRELLKLGREATQGKESPPPDEEAPSKPPRRRK